LIPTSNLAALALGAARRFPDRDALIWRDRAWSWAELDERMRRAATGLVARGLRPGDRVLVHARNSNALFESMWATWMASGVWVPTNFRLTPTEVAYLAENCGAVLHIIDDAFPDHAAAARDANRVMRAEIAIPHGWEELATSGAARDAAADVDRDDPCWLFYTSGTTGRPKGGVLTHGQMNFVVTNHLADLMPGLTHHDASLVVAPLSHGAGVHQLSPASRGAPTILMPGERLDVPEAWRLIERHRVTNLFTVPTILTMLTRDEAVDRHDHSALRYVIYAGAPMYRADQVHALRKLGPILVQYFGLGEVTGNITVLPPHWHSENDDGFPVGTCGYARSGMDIAILDLDGRPLPPNETGEICVRGPAVFAGYWNNPEATAKAFAHGWFHTGDLGHLDARGFLFITGRASDMYISGGSNVYPREIEEALLTHPAVAEACVLGLPHPKWGEAGVAVLVSRETVEVEALMAHLAPRLSRYKLPARVVFWPELPKSGYGKVPKKDVRARLIEEGVGFD